MDRSFKRNLFGQLPHIGAVQQWSPQDIANIVKRYPVFQPLSNLTLFKQFKVTDTLEWDNGKIDIAPEYLYENGIPA